MGGNTFQQENSPQPTAIFDTLIEVVNEAGGASGKVAIACVASKGTLPFICPHHRAPQLQPGGREGHPVGRADRPCQAFRELLGS
ncbi:hypothetical protein O3S81_24965 [Agrobacterium sp. SOY23]|uniref:hypothetical protein n=1 Tax=Agrobacterium sp. SOY23 TaxID=3014555 RepID=UPI0022AF2971|nr:hypothetical protein [Agrobacterium sp. SOY23]MCZ4432966.1 hypothetical protein [Agrobacterium sp. SOY23]